MAKRSILFSGTLEADINEAKSLLEFNDSQIAQFLEISESELERLKPLESHFLMAKNNSDSDNKLISRIGDLLSPLSNFKRHKMNAQDMLSVYNEKHVVNKVEYTFKQLLTFDRFSSEQGRLAALISEERCFSFFKHYTIGAGVNELQKLNLDIIQEFLNKPVDIKEEWVYSEGGDYTVLQGQYLEEAHDDGSESWEEIPLFSSKIEEAWKLVSMLAQKGVQVRLSNKAMSDKYWWCYLSSEPDIDRPDVCAQGDTASEAICRAILDYCKKEK